MKINLKNTLLALAAFAMVGGVTAGASLLGQEDYVVVHAEAQYSNLEFTEACGGSGTASDDAVWTVTSDGDESTFDSSSGIHYGTNKKSVQYVQLVTDDIEGIVTSVVVNARDAQATAAITVNVGDNSLLCNEAASATATNTSEEYAFTGAEQADASDAITVRIDRGSSMTKAIYVKYIVVTYTQAASNPFTSIGDFNYTSNTLYESEEREFTVTYAPVNADEDFIISSSDESVATVSQKSASDGTGTFTVTGISAGNTTITVANTDGTISSSSEFIVEEVAIDDSKTATLTREATGIESGASTYSDWTSSAIHGVVFAGTSAGGNDSIQLRSSDNASGVVTTVSAGNVTKVSVEWNSKTSAGRVVNVYGSADAYSNASDLYASGTYGTLLGSITFGTSTELAIEGTYPYIGIRSNDGALWLDSITLAWGDVIVATPTNMDNLKILLNDGLKMNSISTEVIDHSNTCLTDYADAKGYYNLLDEDEQSLFRNSTYCADGKARYEAWAAANGDAAPYDGNDWVASSSVLGIKVAADSSNAGILIAAILGLGAVVGAAMVVVYRKRKHA